MDNKKIAIIGAGSIAVLAISLFGYKISVESAAEAKIMEKAAEIMTTDKNFKSIGGVDCWDGLGSLTCSISDTVLTSGSNNITLKKLTITNLKDFSRMYDEDNFQIEDGEKLSTNIQIDGFLVDGVELISSLKKDLIHELELDAKNPATTEINSLLNSIFDDELSFNAEYSMSKDNNTTDFNFKTSAGISAVTSILDMSFSYTGDISDIQKDNKTIGEKGVFKNVSLKLNTQDKLVQDGLYLAYKYTYNGFIKDKIPGEEINKEVGANQKDILTREQFEKLALPNIANLMKGSVTSSTTYRQNATTDKLLSKIDGVVIKGDDSLTLSISNKGNLTVMPMISGLYMPFIMQDFKEIEKILDIDIK